MYRDRGKGEVPPSLPLSIHPSLPPSLPLPPRWSRECPLLVEVHDRSAIPDPPEFAVAAAEGEVSGRLLPFPPPFPYSDCCPPSPPPRTPPLLRRTRAMCAASPASPCWTCPR